ncbi:hypothetical protein D3C75_1109960 [compost metagenome]
MRVGLEQLLDSLQRQQATSRGIGVREDDPAIGLGIILDPNLELFVQRYRLEGNSIQTAINRIEAVADIREQQRCAVLEQTVENVCQHFVRTVAEEHLVALDPVVIRHRLL